MGELNFQLDGCICRYFVPYLDKLRPCLHSVIAMFRIPKWLRQPKALLVPYRPSPPFWRWSCVVATTVATVAIVACWMWWNWLNAVQPEMESGSTTLRNVGLVIAALVALPFLIGRSIVSERQSEAALRDSDTSIKNLLQQNYQANAEGLRSDVPFFRLSSIAALDQLAQQHDEYYVRVITLLCAFVRHPYGEIKGGGYSLRSDVRDILGVISRRSEREKSLERTNKLTIDLGGANLDHVFLWQMDLENAILNETVFSEAHLSSIKLSDVRAVSCRFQRAVLTDCSFANALLSFANFEDASLTHVDFAGADLEYADMISVVLGDVDFSNSKLTQVNLSGASFGRVTGLTQEQLNTAIADEDKPPDLGNATDAKTGNRLVWQGGPHNGGR